MTDPFPKTVGLAPPRFKADITIISNIKNAIPNNQASGSREETFVIDGTGEFDVKGLFIHGISASGEPQNKSNGFDFTTIYSIHFEDIRLGFLGSLKQKELTDSQLEDLGEIDILFVPVGGKTVCDAEEAVTIVNQVEPRIVIPMYYAQKGLQMPLEKVDLFLKEVSSGKQVPEEKLTIKKSGLQEGGESTRIVILLPQR